jgi:phage recombination protein Bet
MTNNYFTPEELNVLRANKVIPASASDLQIRYFFEVCKRKKLDPFLKQVHMVERKERDGDSWKVSYTIQAGLDGMRAIAQRNSKLISWKRWTIVKENGKLYGCCKIQTEDRGTYEDECPFDEYVQKKSDGTVTKFWRQFPETMIKKVAEESVLRMLSPEDLSDVYGDDEMDQAHNTLPSGDQPPELLEPPSPEHQEVDVEGTKVVEFDPQKEVVKFGKNKGLKYSELDNGYLAWMEKNSTQKQVREKILATIVWKKMQSAQAENKEAGTDAFDGVFEDNNPVNVNKDTGEIMDAEDKLMDKMEGKKSEKKPTTKKQPEMNDSKTFTDLMKHLKEAKGVAGLAKFIDDNTGLLAMLPEGEKIRIRKTYNELKTKFTGAK